MHRIIGAHLNSFVESNGFQQSEESVQFELFSNFTILSSRISTGFDLGDVTTGEGDDGMDGLAIIIDEEIIVSDEDAKTIFKKPRKNHDVEVVFIQAKSGESFDLGEFLKFEKSVLRFITQIIIK